MTTVRLVIRSLILMTLVIVPKDALADRKTPVRGSRPERLLDLARKNAAIQVIVGVKLEEGWSPAAELVPEQAAKQRERVKERKQELLRGHPRVRLIESRDYQSIPYFVLEVDEHGLRELLDDELVSSIEENASGELTLDASSGLVGATAAYARGYGGVGQAVVIIDTGVDSAHPFFSGRISPAEACFSGFDRADTVCPNGEDRQYGPGAAVPCPIIHNSNLFFCDHGTHVAGIATGRNAGRGFSGVAPDAMIIPIQIASWRTCAQPRECGPTIQMTDVLAALDYVVTISSQYQIAAVNISLRFLPLQTSRSECDNAAPAFRDVIGRLLESRVAVVAGAGNDAFIGRIGIPACVSGAIAVGATTDDDQMASYSNNASFLDLLAPGGANAGTGTDIWSSIPGGGYREQFGTSMAAPHVAGAFALLKQRSPSASINKLLNDLVQTGTWVEDPRVDPPLVKPRINVNAALNLADSMPPSDPGSFTATGSSTAGVGLTWIASTDDVGVAHYQVSRRTGPSAPWVVLANTSATSYTDTMVTASKMYEYAVRAVDTAGLTSGSVRDYAVTVSFTEDPIPGPTAGGGSLIFGRHMGQLREAVDAWREFAGLARVYSSYAPQTGIVLSSHSVGPEVPGIVNALNPARSALSLPLFSYAGVPSPGSGVTIHKEHVQQVRNAVK